MSFETELRQLEKLEVHFDPVHRKVYSVDASIYEVEPLGVVVPKNKEALLNVLAVAKRHNVSVVARGAATGITGGCLGQGLIIDTSKYLNRILEINWDEEYVICEPGVIQDQLNQALAVRGYRLGPDTSTGNRATLGGMLANNAAGARSLIFGTMADHILEVELALANGATIQLRSVDHVEWTELAKHNPIFRTLLDIKNNYQTDIEKNFPQIPRRVSGYNLDALLKTPFNPCRIVAGSEGTLGIVTEMKLKIVKKPKETRLCLLFFADMLEGLQQVETILTYKPIALELIDDKIIEMGRRSPSMRDKLNWLTSNPKAIFVAEFTDFAQMEKLASDFNGIAITNENEMANVWELRKSGLGLLLSKRSYSRAIAFMEDFSVAPSKLASFMSKLLRYLNDKGETAGIYGHIGSGCMHVRPYIDLTKQHDVQLMQKMMLDISDLLLEYGGALSGEHGDGLIRSWLNRKMFGDRLYQAFQELKRAFDPENRMNPGKIVNGPPLLENLRLSPDIPIKQVSTFLDFRPEGGFELAVDLCNGNGQCRKSEKLMCPSFQATKDEFDTTRARAQALRAIIHARLPSEQFTSKGLYDVLDLCLECKGCKTECPSEVDMAKMKAEFLYHYHREHGRPLRSHLFSHIGILSQVASKMPALVNWLSSTQISKTLQKGLGIASQRTLPRLAKSNLENTIKKHSFLASDKKVVLFIDTYTQFFCPEIGLAAIKVIEKLGYEAIMLPWKCCGRPAFSKGKLEYAKQQGEALIQQLLPYAEKNIPILGLEPSCLFMLKDDYVGLMGSDHAAMRAVKNACIIFDEWLAQKLTDHPHAFKAQTNRIKVHAHCHMKALVGSKPTLRSLQFIQNAKVEEIHSGCCGMAGSFGYETEHYEISQKIGELQLFPAIRHSQPDTIFVANGFSCRTQIKEGTGVNALHLAQVIASCLE